MSERLAGHWVTVPDVHRTWSAALFLRRDGTFHVGPMGGGVPEWWGVWSECPSGVCLCVQWEDGGLGPEDAGPVPILLRLAADDTLVSTWTPWIDQPWQGLEWRFVRQEDYAKLLGWSASGLPLVSPLPDNSK